MKVSKWKRGSIALIIWLVIFAGAIITALPFFWMVLTSFKTQIEAMRIPLTWFPSKFHWDNYRGVWTWVPFGTFYINSIIVAVAQTTGVLLTSSLAAYAFARIKFFARDLIFLLYLATMMIPFTVVIIPQYLLMSWLGWVDTYYALIIPGLCGAYGTFLLRQFLITIPSEMEDAAAIDGCNRLQIYWKIMLPLIQPALITLGIFTFMGSWNNLLWPLIVTHSEKMATLPLGLSMFSITEGWQIHIHLGVLMAATTSAVIPILIIFMIGQDYFVKGITLTGLKG